LFVFELPPFMQIAAILETDSTSWYNSVGMLHSTEGEWPTTKMFKIFSTSPLLKGEQRDKLVVATSPRCQTCDWLAYPQVRRRQSINQSMQYSTRSTQPSFVLGRRLFYACAMEGVASAMETAVIGGRNAALLAMHEIEH